MVLRTSAALALALLTSCLAGQQALRAPQPVPVAVALVMDREDRPGVGAVPDAVADRVLAALGQRNMPGRVVPRARWDSDFLALRTTDQRVARLAEKITDADVVLLVETRVSFYSLLNGRFRWSVHVKETLAKRGALQNAVSREFDFAAYLDFEHLREPEALVAAAPAIAAEAGQLADTLLALPPPVDAGARRANDAIYFVLVDRFRNGDPSNDGAIDPADPQGFHGGDLAGVLQSLDYIQSLGVSTVWLSPVSKMRTEKFEGHGAFHGYWVEDLAEVEPRFGDRKLLRALSDALHARGMKLVLDLVLNHVAYDAPLAKARPDWFHGRGSIGDWNDRVQLETYDVHGLPDLAHEKDEVYRHLATISKRWIDDVRPDGFRLDAVKHVPLSFWARFNDEIRAHAGPDFMLLGEDLDGDPARLARTLGEGRFTHVFDFPLYFALVDVFCKDAPRAQLDAILWQDSAYPDARALVTLLDNHDLPRFASSCGGDRKRFDAALAYLRGVRGTPSFLYGTEVALDGADALASRRDMRFPADPSTVRNALAPAPIAPDRTGSGREATVTIALENAPARRGDRVVAVGSAELGGWVPQKGVALAASGSRHEGTITRPLAAVYAYKFAVLRPDGSVEWESRANRFLSMREPSARVRHWNDASEID